MHLNDDQIQRFLHGELAPPEVEVMRNHIAECAVCRQQLNDAEQEEAEAFSLLETLDRPASVVRLETVLAAAARDRFNWGRWAAVVLLGLGAAGVAYAIPGSSARGWFDRLISSVTLREPARTHPKPVASPSEAGIAVDPGENLVIEFAARQIAGHARIRIVDSAAVVVRAQIGSPAFTSDVDRLLIENSVNAGDFKIDVPRKAQRVEI